MAIVSICLPTYEPQSAHLQEAIASILAQTFSDWELIIHDDASTTNVDSIVKSFLKDPRIHFHRSPNRLGIGGNWNATVRLGSAPLIAFLFQDDLWNPHYLERCVTILNREEDVGFITANHDYAIEDQTTAASTGIYEEVRRLRETHLKEGRIAHEEFLRWWIERGLRPNVIGEPSFVMLRRTLIEEVGKFRQDMHQGLDVEYWIRCLLKTDGYWLKENLGTFRVHAKAATAANERSGAGSMDRLRIFRALIQTLSPGPLRRMARKTMMRESWGMAKKFVQRRLFSLQ